MAPSNANIISTLSWRHLLHNITTDSCAPDDLGCPIPHAGVGMMKETPRTPRWGIAGNLRTQSEGPDNVTAVLFQLIQEGRRYLPGQFPHPALDLQDPLAQLAASRVGWRPDL